MAKFKAVIGPMNEKITSSRVSWDFICIWSNDEVHGYSLRFGIESRKFSTQPFGANRQRSLEAKLEQKDLFLLPEIQREISRSEHVSGRVTDILKARLSEQQMASVTALAIRHARK